MAADEINLTYTLYDRLIYGGVMPVNKVLKLETFRDLGPEITYFWERRELGVIKIGGDGVVTVDGKEYPMGGDDQPSGDVVTSLDENFDASTDIPAGWFQKQAAGK